MLIQNIQEEASDWMSLFVLLRPEFTYEKSTMNSLLENSNISCLLETKGLVRVTKPDY